MENQIKKVMIVGASSYIGKYLYNHLSNDFDVSGTSYTCEEFDSVDVTKKEELKNHILKVNPDMIIWLSVKSPKFCEEHPIEAFDICSKGLYHLVEILKEEDLQSKILFFSSDRIFDGKKTLYTESDSPSPVSNYGFTKKAGERVLANSNLDYKVIRTSAVFGKGGVFYEWIVNSLKNNESIGLFSNSYFTPTPMSLLYENIGMIVENWNVIDDKIIHLCGGKRLNRFEFAALIAKKLEIPFSRIYPEEAGSVFADDLSLKPSEIIKFRIDFEDYIGEELER